MPDRSLLHGFQQKAQISMIGREASAMNGRDFSAELRHGGLANR